VLAGIEGYTETWQHRLPLRRIRESRRVALDSDGGLEIVDPSGFGLLPLARGAAVPARVAGDCGMLTALSNGELQGHHAAGTRLAVIMGAFGLEVPSDEVAIAGVVKSAVALVNWGEARRWWFAELVPSPKYAIYERDKPSGDGRDRRHLPTRGNDFVSGFVPLSQAADHFRPTDLAAGVHAEGSVALEHRVHCHVLALAFGCDCLDARNLASLELFAWRVLQIERTERVIPKAPFVQGLAKMTEHALHDGGGLAMREVTAHMATPAEHVGRALKQNRLPREELVANSRASLPLSGQSSARRRVSLVNDVAQCPDLLVSDAAVALSALREAVERLRVSSSPLLADWSVPSGKGALADLLHSDDLYAVAAGAALGSYDIDKLRVSKGDLVPKDAASVTSPEAAKLIDAPHVHILKSDAELRADVDSGALRGQPYWDPILRNSRAKKLEFLRALSAAGLPTWRRRVRCRVGCFFVKEKGSMLRLVIDSRLSASDESFRMVQERLGRVAQAELDSPGDDELVGFSIDLTDGFCQFKCDALASMFGLGYTGTASSVADEFGIALNDVFDDDLQAADPVQPTEVLEACFLGMAMGWSWALYFCNERPACIGPRVPALAPYVDNANMLAVGRDEGRRVFDLVLGALRRRGFALRDHVDGEPVFEFLGLVLDGPRRRLRRARCWRLWSALGRVLTLGRLSGDAMRVLCGHRCHHFGLRPPLLSILQRVYAFSREQLGKVAILPADVWGELWIARSMLPFADADLRRPLCRTVWCSDASLLGYAFHETTAGLAEVFDVAQWKERWRFREVMEHVDRESRDVPAAAAIGPDTGQDWATVMVGAVREDTRVPSAAVAAPSRLGAPYRHFERVEGTVPPLPGRLTHAGRWSLVVAGCWRRREAIHLLEARAALLGLRRAAGSAGGQDAVVVSLGDSLSELLAQERGRACNYALNSCCREAAAWQVAAGVDWRRRNVDADRNPSDKDSRLGDRGKLAPGDTFTLHGPARQRAQRRADASNLLQRDLVSAAWAAVAPSTPERGLAAAELRCVAGPEAARPSAGRHASRFVLEPFAGCDHLSGAALQAGLDVAVPFELDNCSHFDIRRLGILGLIIEWIRQGRVWWVHLGLATVSFAEAAGPPGAGLTWRPPPVLGQRQGSYVRLAALPPLSSAGSAPPVLGVFAFLPSGGALGLVAGAARPRPARKVAVAKRRAARGGVTSKALEDLNEAQPAPEAAAATERAACGGAALAAPTAREARPAAAMPAGLSRGEQASRRAAEGGPSSEWGLTTKDRYSAAFDEFQAWAVLREQPVMKLAKDVDNLDAIPVTFFEGLYLRKKATSIARDGLFGKIFELGLDAGPNVRPRCRRSLQGFRRDDPPVSAGPRPGEAAALVAAALLEDGPLRSGLSGRAFGGQYDPLTRPPETLNILRENSVAPDPVRAAAVGAPVPSTLTAARKRQAAGLADRGVFDGTVLDKLWGLGFEFALEVFLGLQKCAIPCQPLFSPLSLGEYERHILKGAQLAVLNPPRVTPHLAWHDGASPAMHLQLLDLKMLQTKGRWSAPRSVKRYKGKLLRQAAAIRNKIPAGAALPDPAGRDSLKKMMLAAANSI
ncbi:unnamed protein product, partial [Prorocentrum cordatum]